MFLTPQSISMTAIYKIGEANRSGHFVKHNKENQSKTIQTIMLKQHIVTIK